MVKGHRKKAPSTSGASTSGRLMLDQIKSVKLQEQALKIAELEKQLAATKNQGSSGDSSLTASQASVFEDSASQLMKNCKVLL